MRPAPLNKARARQGPHHHLYVTAEWRSIRAAQLAREPWCRECAKSGIKTRATICDHLERHNGDREEFLRGPFQSLCKGCHDRHKQRLELHGYEAKIGADGYPVDDRHPFNRA